MSADRDDEAAFVDRLRSGDRKAFGELVTLHRTTIFRLVRGYVKSDAEAEDLTQHAFLQALRAIGAFRGDAGLRTWLHRIAVNAALNYQRDSKRQASISIEEIELITNALGTGKMAAREARRKLSAALERLPSKQRAVVELRMVHELPFKAIAEITTSSEEAARTNYHHAVKSLREWILG